MQKKSPPPPNGKKWEKKMEKICKGKDNDEKCVSLPNNADADHAPSQELIFLLFSMETFGLTKSVMVNS